MAITSAKVGDIVYLKGYLRSQYEATVTAVDNDKLVASWHTHPAKKPHEKYYSHTNTYYLSQISKYPDIGCLYILVSKRKPAIIIQED